MPALDALLTRSEALAKGATPGPWRTVDDRELRRGRRSADGERYVVESAAYSDEEPGICGDHSDSWWLLECDADFIAHARTALPKLVAIVRVLMKGAKRYNLVKTLAEVEALAAGKES